MAIAFYNPIAAFFHNSICAASNFNKMVDCCDENITEFGNVIEKCHAARNCQLAKCQVKLFLDNLKMYLGAERKSSR